MARGGKREGAGRKSCGLDTISKVIRIDRHDAEFIKQLSNDVGITQAEVIHEIIEAYIKQCEE